MLAFHVRGKAYNDIQEMNHYITTWQKFTELNETLFGWKLALETTEYSYPEDVEKWKNEHPTEKWIPDDWNRALDVSQRLWWDAT